MNIINKDILTVDRGIIFHQVNCQGIMGSGLALALKTRFPNLEYEYQKFCNHNISNLLGNIHLFQAREELYVANVFGQNRYGRERRHTSYDAVVKAFEYLHRVPSILFPARGLPLYFPYKMGCNLAGGDWNIYSAIIETYFPLAIICKHG